MHVGMALKIIPLQASHVHQDLLWSWFTGEGRNRAARIACQ